MPRKRSILSVVPTRYREDFAQPIDGRSRLGRELRDRYNGVVADLGGDDTLSHAQRSLARRAVMMEIVIENEESRIADGGGIDIAPHTQLVGGLLQIYRTLGLKRVTKQVRLSDYLAKGKP